jgi:hypothetical protein
MASNQRIPTSRKETMASSTATQPAEPSTMEIIAEKSDLLKELSVTADHRNGSGRKFANVLPGDRQETGLLYRSSSQAL